MDEFSDKMNDHAVLISFILLSRLLQSATELQLMFVFFVVVSVFYVNFYFMNIINVAAIEETA